MIDLAALRAYSGGAIVQDAADEIENLRTTVSEDLKYQRKLEAELRELRAIYDGLCK